MLQLATDFIAIALAAAEIRRLVLVGSTAGAAEVTRRKLHDVHDPQVRRSYVRALVGEVVMTWEEITIRSPNRALELAVGGRTPSDAAVRTDMGDWRTRQDSNL